MSDQPSESSPRKRPLPTWEQMTRDTSPEAQAVLLRLQREMPVWRKWELLDDLIRTERMFAWAGLKRRHPDASDAELRRRMADLLLGEELAAEVYGAWEEWEDG